MKEFTNLLTRPTPKELLLGGTPYAINSDFRIGIRYGITLESDVEDITDEDKLLYVLRIFYEKFPSTDVIRDAVRKMVWFMGGGEEDFFPHRVMETKGEKIRKVFDFVTDSKLIFAAMYAQYGIDLNPDTTPYLHWWKFRAMFAGLNDTHEIVKIIGYRSCNTGQIKDKTYRAEIRRLQRVHALPVSRAPSKEKMQQMAGSIFGPAMANAYEKQQIEKAGRSNGS